MSNYYNSIVNTINKIEQLNPYWVLICPFAIVAIVVLFLPDYPLKDERFFYPLVKVFGEHYLPSIDVIKNMDQSMGPVYFIIYGFIGKLTNYSLSSLRLVDIFISFVSVLALYKTLYQFSRYPLCLTLWFTINPYFLLLTTPLLYTDNLCMMFILMGTYFFLIKQNLLASGLLWGLALCTRQTAIIIPLAALLTELYVYRVNLAILFRKFILSLIPFLLLFGLVYLWDFSITPPNTVHKVNSFETLGFSLRQLNYTILLLGVYSSPLWLPQLAKIIKKPIIFAAVAASALLILEFPRTINENRLVGWESGLMDRFLMSIGDLAYIIVPLLWIPALGFLILTAITAVRSRQTLFGILCVLSFLGFQSFYSYSWDKYFILVIPFIFLANPSIRQAIDNKSIA